MFCVGGSNISALESEEDASLELKYHRLFVKLLKEVDQAKAEEETVKQLKADRLAAEKTVMFQIEGQLVGDEACDPPSDSPTAEVVIVDDITTVPVVYRGPLPTLPPAVKKEMTSPAVKIKTSPPTAKKQK